jgi:hypothetical protein
LKSRILVDVHIFAAGMRSRENPADRIRRRVFRVSETDIRL